MAIGQIEAQLSSPRSVPAAGTAEEQSDGQLLARFIADRDETAELAFAGLVRRHGPMVFHVCQQIVGDRHTAEDAFQATFLILAGRPARSTSPSCSGTGSMAWLFGLRGRQGCGTIAGDSASARARGTGWRTSRPDGAARPGS